MAQPSADNSITILIPCLRETETLEFCIAEAKEVLAKNQIPGKVLVANNGGKDECYEIAKQHADEVVLVENMGYGNALMGGTQAADTKFILFADADGSYNFEYIPSFYKKLLDGYDLVMGCRLPSGGGRIEKGAMPFLHQYIGNPLFSILIKMLFACPLTDPNCGMRAYRKDFYEKLDLKCPGMEYASEFLIRSSQNSKNITEIPITLRKDKRVLTQKHLSTFRDGWRHLKIYIRFKLGLSH